MFQTCLNKFMKTSVINANPNLRKHVPEFCMYNRRNAMYMLEKHVSVFVKPNEGARGFGIVRLRKRDEQVIECIDHRGNVKYTNYSQLPEWSQDKYIIQEAIDIPCIDGRVWDIRIHLQKLNDTWEIMGNISKLGEEGKVVTNNAHGGKSIDTEELLSRVIEDKSTISHTIFMLDTLSAEIAYTLEVEYAGIRELGIDLALDKNNNIWIIEANTNPPSILFKNIEFACKAIDRNKKYLRANVETQNFSFEAL